MRVLSRFTGLLCKQNRRRCNNWVPAQSVLRAGVDGVWLEDVKADTVAVSSRLHQTRYREIPLATPIYHAATYKVQGVQHFKDILNDGGYYYSRCGNPTCEAVECSLRDLEGGAGTLVFSTGMAAITTALMACLNAGDHIIAPNPMYSATASYLVNYLALKYNTEVSWVRPGCSMNDYEKLLRPNTKVLYAETPCNPILAVTDIEAFAELGQSLPGVVTMVDSTLGSPYLQQPCKMGVDITLHSGTKYIGGHGDLVAGVLTTRTQDMWKTIYSYRTTLGNTLSPFDASLLLRGVKTLPVRMDRHGSNAMKVASYLESHPKVEKVNYPGLPTCIGHEVAKSQMKNFGGMLSFEMKGGLEAGKAVIESVGLIQLAVSLGGVESLIEHPASMTHGPMVMTDQERIDGLITDGLIRLSVGLENVDDLIADLHQALDKVKEQ